MFLIPHERLGIPKIGLVIVPAGVLLEGELVGYDHEQNELGRALVTSNLDRPPGAAGA